MHVSATSQALDEELDTLFQKRLKSHFSSFYEDVDQLGEKGELEEISTGRYKMRQRGAYITGEVELTAKGSAYIISNESKEDVFVAFPNLKHALNGDKVKVLVYARSRDRRPEGEVVEIDR